MQCLQGGFKVIRMHGIAPGQHPGRVKRKPEQKENVLVPSIEQFMTMTMREL